MVSSAEKAELARSLGADLVLDRNDFPGLAYRPEETSTERARRLAATRDLRSAIAAGLGQSEESAEGVDVVFEHIGQETFPASVYLTRRMGRIVICGATTGYELTFDVRHLWMKQKTIIGAHGSNAERASAPTSWYSG